MEVNIWTFRHLLLSFRLRSQKNNTFNTRIEFKSGLSNWKTWILCNGEKEKLCFIYLFLSGYRTDNGSWQNDRAKIFLNFEIFRAGPFGLKSWNQDASICYFSVTSKNHRLMHKWNHAHENQSPAVLLMYRKGWHLFKRKYLDSKYSRLLYFILYALIEYIFRLTFFKRLVVEINLYPSPKRPKGQTTQHLDKWRSLSRVLESLLFSDI